jgi:DNA-binding MarR family transcriptional regulator
MQLQHHSTVELIDRLAERGFLCRLRATDDRRQVFVKLTHKGEEFLEKLALHHLQEWQTAGPTFVKLLQAVIENTEETPSTNDVPQKSKIEVSSKPRKENRHG